MAVQRGKSIGRLPLSVASGTNELLGFIKNEPKFIDIETASPPVSPSVVVAILMLQKTRVTSGTLLRAFSAEVFILIRFLWSELRL